MPGGIWEAIGRALQAGTQTYGALSAEEREREEREATRRQQAEQFAQSLGLQREEFAQNTKAREADQAFREKEAQRRLIDEAITNIAPDTEVPPSLLESIQKSAPEYLGRLNVKPGAWNAGTVTEGLGDATEGNPLGLAAGGAGPTKAADTGIRRATLPERGALNTIQAAEKAAAQKAKFEQWLVEHPKATPDERFAAAAQFEQQWRGLSPAEEEAQWNKREQAAYRRALAIANVHAQNARGTPVERWLAGKNIIEDNIRAKYSQELTAFAKAAAENVAGAAERLAELQTKITQEADATASKILGPIPGSTSEAFVGPQQDNTDVLINEIDTAVQGFGGDYSALKQSVLADQQELRKAGVDVARYLSAIRAKEPTGKAYVGELPPPIGSEKFTKPEYNPRNNPRIGSGRPIGTSMTVEEARRRGLM